MNVILGTAFSLTLGVWRLRINIAIEDTELDRCAPNDMHRAADRVEEERAA